jgi:hypothetical protein
MISDTLLLAALTDLIGVVVAIVFIIIYSLNHLLQGKGNQPPGRNPQRRPGEPAERPLRPAQPQQKPKDAVSQLNSEIEQFLKRAGQRRSEKPARDRAAGPPPSRPPKPPQPAREPLREQAVDVEPVEHRGFDDVATSVEKHMANRSFAQRAEHLADDIERADEDMEAHLQQAFSHKVGTLAGESPQASAAAVTDTASKVTDEGSTAMATALAAMLATPQGMRQAILLGEILVRPEHRW